MGGASGMVYASIRDKDAVDSVKLMVVMSSSTQLGLDCAGFLKYTLFIPYNLQVQNGYSREVKFLDDTFRES